MEKTQREYYLNEQLKAIQKNLVHLRMAKMNLTNLKTKLIKRSLVKSQEKALSELKKLEI